VQRVSRCESATVLQVWQTCSIGVWGRSVAFLHWREAAEKGSGVGEASV
jgi:hypothetical protein